MEAFCFHWLCVVAFSYVLLLFAQKAFVHLWWTPKRIQKHFKNQGITGPKYHFLFGNLKEIASFTSATPSWPSSFISHHDILPTVLPFYHHWKKIYGSIFVIWFGPTARVTISDPALIRDIFVRKSDNFEKNESPALVKKLEGDGLLSLKGEKWAHHRKIITPTFYIENLRLMIPMMGKSMREMLEKWSKMSNASGKVEIEVSEMFSTLSEDVITRIVFGSSYEDGRAIFELQAQQMVYATEAYQKVFIPGYRFLPTKKNRISWRLDKEVRKSLMKLIEERRKISSKHHQVLSEECPNDLLEVMIKATQQHHDDEYRNSSSNMTVNDIVEECKTIFFAGKHTTSNLLTWTTILLAMHPQWQELAREEVLRVCGARDPPSKDDLSKLKTLGMILNESVRLYPPAVAAIRRAKTDTQLGDFSLPRGTELLIPIIAIHHDQTLWGEDANEFNPARFGRGVAQAAKHPMAFMPFGLGARRCVGQNLAVLQAKLAIAMILQRFSFDLSPSYKHAPTILMLLCPQYGAPIIFQKL
ncbi:CytochromeA2 [Capsicum annuum]|uniref:CytochromeA2 n=1 Tax=Capsicum annuum TaxID=4072 RepID=A0A2G3A3F4_CAPAN|nr:cytochrome P450 734A1 [Capsicum annuum]KAF3657707.1 CytochromeA2 [Capsicum annuum]PHT88756.1 CytochromeA2 [Capsicum annuum]